MQQATDEEEEEEDAGPDGQAPASPNLCLLRCTEQIFTIRTRTPSSNGRCEQIEIWKVDVSEFFFKCTEVAVVASVCMHGGEEIARGTQKSAIFK